MALSADRNTPFKHRERVVVLKVKDDAVIYAGAMVAVGTDGFAVPASDAAGLIVIGRAEEQVDNTNGGDGGATVRVARGVFKYKNDAATNDVVQADVGRPVYVKDDQTVTQATGATNNVVAGICEEIDADGGIWVAMFAQTYTTISGSELMSILDRAKFSDIYFDLNTLFNGALASHERVAEQVATTIRTNAPLMKYKWLGQVPNMQRWVGERVIQKLRGQSQVIENEDWANGLEVDRDDLDDDKLSIVAPRIRDLAAKGLDAMEEEVISYYTAGFAGTKGTTYDGQYLFDSDHKAATPGDTSQSNVNSDAFTANGSALVTAYKAMLGFKDENGKPLGIRPTTLLHGPAIWGEVRECLLVPTLSGGGVNANYGLVKPVMSKFITDASWFLIDSSQGAMPVILQIRRDPTFREDGNDHFFMNKSFRFGADATFGVGYGLWQTAFGSDG